MFLWRRKKVKSLRQFIIRMRYMEKSAENAHFFLIIQILVITGVHRLG